MVGGSTCSRGSMQRIVHKSVSQLDAFHGIVWCLMAAM